MNTTQIFMLVCSIALLFCSWGILTNDSSMIYEIQFAMFFAWMSGRGFHAVGL